MLEFCQFSKVKSCKCFSKMQTTTRRWFKLFSFLFQRHFIQYNIPKQWTRRELEPGFRSLCCFSWRREQFEVESGISWTDCGRSWFLSSWVLLSWLRCPWLALRTHLDTLRDSHARLERWFSWGWFAVLLSCWRWLRVHEVSHWRRDQSFHDKTWKAFPFERFHCPSRWPVVLSCMSSDTLSDARLHYPWTSWRTCISFLFDIPSCWSWWWRWMSDTLFQKLSRRTTCDNSSNTTGRGNYEWVDRCRCHCSVFDGEDEPSRRLVRRPIERSCSRREFFFFFNLLVFNWPRLFFLLLFGFFSCVTLNNKILLNLSIWKSQVIVLMSCVRKCNIPLLISLSLWNGMKKWDEEDKSKEWVGGRLLKLWTSFLWRKSSGDRPLVCSLFLPLPTVCRISWKPSSKNSSFVTPFKWSL